MMNDGEGDIATDADIATARDTAFAVARARNLNVEDAEDLAQTVAEKLLREQAVPDNVAAWSRKVTQNAIIDLDRKRKKKHTQDGEDVWAAREVGLAADQADALLGVAMFVRSQRATSAQGMQRQANEEMMQLLGEVLSPRELELLSLLAEGRSLRGDYESARRTLNETRQGINDTWDILGAPMDPRMQAELDWLEQSRDMVGSTSPEYLSKRLRADRTRKSRGYDRTQGGEVGEE